MKCCENKEADEVFLEHYWMKRIRRSRRLSYVVYYLYSKVAWIQVADPFGTKLKQPLQNFDISEVIGLCCDCEHGKRVKPSIIFDI